MSIAGMFFALLGSLAYHTLAQECDPECFPGHGICSNGLCFCNSPWSGDDCSIVASQPHVPPVPRRGPSRLMSSVMHSPQVLTQPQQLPRAFLDVAPQGPSRLMSSVTQSPQVLPQPQQLPRKFLDVAAQGSERMSPLGFRNPTEGILTTPVLRSRPLNDAPALAPAASIDDVWQELPLPRAALPQLLEKVVTPHLGDAAHTAARGLPAEDAIIAMRLMAQQLQAEEKKNQKLDSANQKLESALQGLNAMPVDDFSHQYTWPSSRHMFVMQDPYMSDKPILNEVTAVCIGVPIGIELILIVVLSIMAVIDGYWRDWGWKKDIRKNWFHGYNPCCCTKLMCSKNYGMCYSCSCGGIGLIIVFMLMANGGWIFLCTTPVMHYFLYQAAFVCYVSFIVMGIAGLVWHEVCQRARNRFEDLRTQVKDLIQRNVELVQSMNVVMGGKIKEVMKQKKASLKKKLDKVQHIMGHDNERYLARQAEKKEKALEEKALKEQLVAAEALQQELADDDEAPDEEEEPSCWNACRAPRPVREPLSPKNDDKPKESRACGTYCPCPCPSDSDDDEA